MTGRPRALIARAAAVASVVALAFGTASGAGAHDGSSHDGIPIGDGKVSLSAPQPGYVFACQTPQRKAPPRTGPWIKDNLWYPDLKPIVQGSVAWPNAQNSQQAAGRTRTLRTNGVPVGSTTGTFPIAPTDPAYQYDKNPNAIAERTLTVKVPADPQVAAKPTCLPMGAVGFATNGVAFYNALDDDSNDAVAHEIQDACDGHPQKQGQYHYHSGSRCLVDKATGSSTLIGYALDGFGIYVERNTAGALLTNADLDQCHGRTSQVTWDGKRRSMYHYVVTQEYPYTLGCFAGTPTKLTGAQRGSSNRPGNASAGAANAQRPAQGTGQAAGQAQRPGPSARPAPRNAILP